MTSTHTQLKTTKFYYNNVSINIHQIDLHKQFVCSTTSNVATTKIVCGLLKAVCVCVATCTIQLTYTPVSEPIHMVASLEGGRLLRVFWTS